MPSHKLLPQSSLHETKQGTVSLNGFSVSGASIARMSPTPVISVPTSPTVIFTCPAGKKAVRVSRYAYNPTGGTINLALTSTISGIDYTAGAVSVNAGGTANSASIGEPGFNGLLNAGEVQKISADNPGLLLMQSWLVFDDTSPIKQVYLDVLQVGDNTLYTCPAGKVAMVLSCGPFGPTTISLNEFNVTNVSGGTVNAYINVVESGGSPSAANQMTPSFACNNNASTSKSLPSVSLQAGDYISIHSDVPTNQTCLVRALIVELDA